MNRVSSLEMFRIVLFETGLCEQNRLCARPHTCYPFRRSSSVGPDLSCLFLYLPLPARIDFLPRFPMTNINVFCHSLRMSPSILVKWSTNSVVSWITFTSQQRQ